MAEEAPAHVIDRRETDFGIDEERTKRIKKQAGRFIQLFQRSVLEGWALGKEFHEVKPKLKHGYFTPWVETQIGLSSRTAQRLMDLYARDPEKRHVADFKSTAEALRLLPPAKLKGKDKSARAGGDEQSKRKAEVGKPSTTTVDLGASIAQLEPILHEMLRSPRSPREEDLQALVKLTTLAAATVDRQLRLAASGHEKAVGLSDEVVGKLRGALEAVIGGQQDVQEKLI